MDFQRGEDIKATLQIGEYALMRDRIIKAMQEDKRYIDDAGYTDIMLYSYSLYYGDLKMFKFMVDNGGMDDYWINDTYVKLEICYPIVKNKLKPFNIRYAEKKLRYLLSKGILPPDDLKGKFTNKEVIKILNEYNFKNNAI